MPARKKKTPVIKCVCCLHEKRDEIDRALFAGTSHRQVASAFGITHSTVGRHSRHYTARTKNEIIRAKAKAAVEVDNYSIPNVIDLTEKANVLSELSQVYAHQKAMFLRAMHTSDTRAAARSLSDSKETLSLFARVHGLVSGDGTQIVLSMTSESAQKKLESAINMMSEDQLRDYLLRADPHASDRVAEMREHVDLYDPDPRRNALPPPKDEVIEHDRDDSN